MSQRRILFGGVFLLLLSGCKAPVPLTYYNEPAPDVTTATIKGETTDPGFSKSINDLYSYAAGVDGDYLAKPDEPHNRSVTVRAGTRFVTLGCHLGGTTGLSSFPVEIKAGESYTAKCECGPYGHFDDPYVFIWLQDGAGRTVTEKKVARLEAGGGVTVIPIFIPHR